MKLLKNTIIQFIMAICFALNLYAQNDDTHKTFSTIICEYSLPRNKNGLSVTAFNVTPRIRIEKWEKNAMIILSIAKEQGTASNPNPSFLHSYNYGGKQYGEASVGFDVFENIKLTNLTYEVLVTHGAQSWGWKRVDGMGNQFGPIAKNAKASEVNVSVRIVAGYFSGNGPIENKIRGMLKEVEDKKQEKREQDKIEIQRKQQEKEDAAQKETEKKQAETKNIAKTNAEKKEGENTKEKTEKETKEKETKEKKSEKSEKEKKEGGGVEGGATKEDLEKTEREKAEAEKAQAAQAEQAERERKEAELVKKQADYDAWKSTAQSKNDADDLESMETLGFIMLVLGGWVYGGMGDYDRILAYNPNKEKLQFCLGVDYGYSMTLAPVLFDSDKSTMSGGVSSNDKTLLPNDPFYLNFDANFKMGAEHKYYGFYGYGMLKGGVKPNFRGTNFSLLYGGRVFAGPKAIQAYFDYGRGFRNFSTTSSDVEENGSGKSSTNVSRIEFGLKFTYNRTDYRRDHLYLGIVKEVLTLDAPHAYISSKANVKFSKSTPSMTGFTFQWDREHTFRLYANLFPNYLYVGEASQTSVGSSLSEENTGIFFELGFLRTFNFFQ